ncbi:hydrolase [Azohydromonas lata]|uniref:Hydrolase n=1 Tax=Azohydromonas lata TaxID=45677 RepID=A0ABU5INP2_9BURK|nr:hydrolase [Azohydromonas lata]MDZ5460523.1 hydrolase [Azohydromonas lata]
MTTLRPSTTALVLIDLQHGISSMELSPRSGDEVVTRSIEVARRFRDAGALVVLVRVAFSDDLADAPPHQVDHPMGPPAGGFPADWACLPGPLAELGHLTITKRQWSAFHGTELDLQLRRRGCTTVAMGGIATNFGVESTARQAWELSYDVVVLEDLCTSTSAELHGMAVTQVLPRLARVTTSACIKLGTA